MSDYIEHKCDRCGSYTCRGYTCQEAEILRLSDEVARLEAENRRLLRDDQPWPLVDVVARLVAATDHLLNDHDCDAHGWELFSHAAAEARNWLAERARDVDAARAAIPMPAPTDSAALEGKERGNE